MSELRDLEFAPGHCRGSVAPPDEPPGRLHGGLAAQAREIGAHEPLGPGRQRVEIDVAGQRAVTGVHAEDRPAGGQVGERYLDLDVEAAGPQQGRIEDVRPVRRRQDDHAAQLLDAVQLGEELAHHPLAHVTVPAAAARAGAPGRRSHRGR